MAGAPATTAKMKLDCGMWRALREEAFPEGILPFVIEIFQRRRAFKVPFLKLSSVSLLGEKFTFYSPHMHGNNRCNAP